MLIVLRNGVNYKAYPSSIDSRMKDFIFVKIIETNKFSNDKFNLNNYCLEEIHFYKVETLDYANLSIV